MPLAPLTGLAIAGGVSLFFIFLWMSISLYQKCGPNEALIISGWGVGQKGRSFKIIVGGGAVMLPMLQQKSVLSLAVLPLEIDTKTPIFTSDNIPLNFDAVAEVKVKGDDVSIATAAECLMGNSEDEVKRLAVDVLKTSMREIVSKLTAEELIHNIDHVFLAVKETAIANLAKMGLTVVSFSIREISDSVGYLKALGEQAVLAKKSQSELKAGTTV